METTQLTLYCFIIDQTGPYFNVLKQITLSCLVDEFFVLALQISLECFPQLSVIPPALKYSFTRFYGSLNRY